MGSRYTKDNQLIKRVIRIYTPVVEGLSSRQIRDILWEEAVVDGRPYHRSPNFPSVAEVTLALRQMGYLFQDGVWIA